MPTVMLPGLKGARAKRELIKLAVKFKNKYDIHFNRDANDEFEALYGILTAMEMLLQEEKKKLADVDKTRAFIDAIISEKGEITAEGVYVWPRHLKEEAEELGVDWSEFKNQLKQAGLLEFDPKKKKYKVNM